MRLIYILMSIFIILSSHVFAETLIDPESIISCYNLTMGESGAYKDETGNFSLELIQGGGIYQNITGISGTAMNFTFSSAPPIATYLRNLTHINPEDYNTGLTIEGWIKYDGAGTCTASKCTVFDWEQATSNGHVSLFIEPDNDLNYRFDDTTADHNYVNIEGGPIVESNEWFHFAATHNATADTLWINGVLVHTTTSGTLTGTDTYFQIGAYATQYYSLEGGIDQLCIFNVALDAFQVAQLNDSSNPLDAFYPFLGTPPAPPPPECNSFNSTSCGGDITSPYTCSDPTPTYTMNCSSTVTNVTMANFNGSVAVMGEDRVCTNTVGNTWSCTLIPSDSLPVGTSNVYIAAENISNGQVHYTLSNVRDGNKTVSGIQFLRRQGYNGFNLFNYLEIMITNFEPTNITVTITGPSNFNDSILDLTVGAYSTNSITLFNHSNRTMTDDDWNISESIFNGTDIGGVTNPLDILLSVDPPRGILEKLGIWDCSYNLLLDYNLDLLLPLQLTGTGTATLESKLTTTGFIPLAPVDCFFITRNDGEFIAS